MRSTANGSSFLLRQGFFLALLVMLSVPVQGQAPSEQQQVTLFVIDFDNLEGDARLDWLSKALKDMVLLRMEPEARIIAKDAGSIRPFLEARESGRRGKLALASNSLLLMGSYYRQGALLVIEVQFLDLRDWSSLAMGRVEAPYGDIPQVNTLLTERVVEIVKRLDYYSGVDLDAPLAREDLAAAEAELALLGPARRYGTQAPAVSRDMLHALDDLEEAMDVYSGFRQPASGTQQAGERYFRDFKLEGSGILPVERARYTALFEDMLKRVAQNPYAAELGELGLEVDPYNNDRVYLTIPVTYRIKQTLLEDMLFALPYVSTREQGRLRFIRYDRSKFNFSPALLGSIARGDYRVIPVVQMLDEQGRLRAAIVDSPDMSWERYFPDGPVKVVRQRRFVSMMAITTSGFSVDVRMETVNLETKYEFDVDVNVLPSLARVAVVFMKEQELLKFLQSLPQG